MEIYDNEFNKPKKIMWVINFVLTLVFFGAIALFVIKEIERVKDENGIKGVLMEVWEGKEVKVN